MSKASTKRQLARVFTTGRSQAVRLPKEFRFDTDTVMVHREGNAVILEPVREWPDNYVQSFSGVLTISSGPPRGKASGEASSEAARAGTPIGPLDSLIAAHAVARKLSLVLNQ